MWFSTGIVELAAIAVAACITLLMYLSGSRLWKRGAVISACTAVAAVVTPADVVSLLMMASLFTLAFVCGSRFPAWTRN